MEWYEVNDKSKEFLSWMRQQCESIPEDTFIYRYKGVAMFQGVAIDEQIFWHLETFCGIKPCGILPKYTKGIRYAIYRLSDGKPHPIESHLKPLSVLDKARVFAKDNFKCVKCGSEENLQIDHIYPRSKGGGNEPDNLQTLCRSCNIRKFNKV